MAISIRSNDEKETISNPIGNHVSIRIESRIRVTKSSSKVYTRFRYDRRDDSSRSDLSFYEIEREGRRSLEGSRCLWRDWCVLRNCSATDVRIERGKRRAADGHDHVEVGRRAGITGDLRLGPRIGGNGCHDPAAAGKLAAPCGPQARAQRGPGPPLLPGKVRSHGSDR